MTRPDGRTPGCRPCERASDRQGREVALGGAERARFKILFHQYPIILLLRNSHPTIPPIILICVSDFLSGTMAGRSILFIHSTLPRPRY